LACTHTDDRASAKRLTAPPCSYMNAVVCTGFWVVSLIAFIGNIAYSYAEFDGIHAKDMPVYYSRQSLIVVGWLWLALMFTFNPRLPDLWVLVWVLLCRVPAAFGDYSNGGWLRWVPIISLFLASLLLIAIRLKLIFNCLRDIRKHR